MKRTSVTLVCLSLLGASLLTAHADAKPKPRHAHAQSPHGAPSASAAPKPDSEPTSPAADSPAAAPTAQAEPSPTPADTTTHESSLPEAHQPKLSVNVDPQHSVKVGEVAQITISAQAPVGDDVTIADQSFAPFEIYKKQARVEPPNGATQRFVFTLELLALEAGDKTLPAIELRVVTKDNNVGSVRTTELPYKVQSLIANEPNAQPKLETKPVVVLQDNFLPIYIAAGLAAAGAVAGLTLLIARYLRRRKAAAVPPPPPRPPWEIAVEKLLELRERKQAMLDAGQGAQFIDQLSDVVRAYLGGRYVFEGLETTTDEMLMQLKTRGASLGFTQEVGQFLGRCDLVKFAKLEPDADEVDLLFAKAQDLVHLSEPERQPSAGKLAGVVQPHAAPRSQHPPDRGPVV
jgi:hypothetical protein